jgi:hypothetical protein
MTREIEQWNEKIKVKIEVNGRMKVIKGTIE